MLFNIATIILFIIQGLFIIWLAKQLECVSDMLTAVFAYFQQLAQDLGYPMIMPMPDDDDELKNWSNARKNQDGET